MDFIIFLCIGAVAGWLSGNIMRGGGFGILGNILVGIAGSVIGGFVFGLLGLGSNNMIGSIITATGGSVLLLFVISKLKK